MPGDIIPSTVMVMVELPEPGAGMVTGLKVTVAPKGGRVVKDREIGLLNPPLTVVVMVEVPWPPWTMVSEAGEAEIVKFCPALAATVNMTVIFC